MYFRAIEIRDVKIGLSSNNEKLIGDPEYFEKIVPQSLLTDYYQVKEIPYSADLDAHVTLIDEKGIRTKVLHSDRELQRQKIRFPWHARDALPLHPLGPGNSKGGL
jgi:hypothetical protein